MEIKLNGIILSSYPYKRIRELKEKLRKTDYKAIKYAEGEISIADYMETLNQRKAWRKEINDLEVELEKLTTQMVNEV